MPDINISLESAVEVGYQLNAMQVLSVDLDTTAILRQIIEIDTIDEIIQLKTIDADLEDVFRDADFELDSEFNPNISLKSGVTDEEISRALSDGIKVYPARVIYHTDDGVYVESVFEDEQLKGATMISGEYSRNISFSHRIKNHNLYNYESGNIKAKISIDDASVSLGSKFVLATSIRKRKLRAFRFEVRPSASTSARFGAHVTGKFTKSEVKKILSQLCKILISVPRILPAQSGPELIEKLIQNPT